jgi:hypothetical protein
MAIAQCDCPVVLYLDATLQGLTGMLTVAVGWAKSLALIQPRGQKRIGDFAHVQGRCDAPSPTLRAAKTWMPGTSPGMTEQEAQIFPFSRG